MLDPDTKRMETELSGNSGDDLQDKYSFINKAAELRGQTKYDEADAVIERSLAIYPDDLDLYFHYALNAENRNNPNLERLRWATFVKIFPAVPAGRAALCKTLLRGDETEKASQVVTQAIEELGTCQDLEECKARIFEARREWDSAIIKWNSISGGPSLDGINFPLQSFIPTFQY